MPQRTKQRSKNTVNKSFGLTVSYNTKNVLKAELLEKIRNVVREYDGLAILQTEKLQHNSV